MKKKIIFQTRPGIGDMCIFLTYIIELIKKNPGSEFFLVTKRRSYVHDLLHQTNLIKKIFYVPESKSFSNQLNFFKNLKNYSFDTAYIYHYGINYFLFCFFLGVKNINFYGIVKKKENICFKAEIETRNWLKDDRVNFNPEFLNKKITYGNQDTITIGIGGSGQNKKWPINNYISLIKKILEIRDFNFIIAGGREEESDFQRIKEALSELKVNLVSLCNYSIKDAVIEISKSKLYIGNDTGFMHIAGCLGIESFGIFGDTSVNYCDYNKKIHPIKIKNDRSCKSDDIKLVSEDYVLNYFKDRLKVI